MGKLSTRVRDALIQLTNLHDELEEIIPQSFETYTNNNIISAACERYAERIIELIINTTHVILKEKGIVLKDKPFGVLSDLNIVEPELAIRLEKMKGMRNMMVHQYDAFDSEVFFESLKELLTDCKMFVDSIRDT